MRMVPQGLSIVETAGDEAALEAVRLTHIAMTVDAILKLASLDFLDLPSPTVLLAQADVPLTRPELR